MTTLAPPPLDYLVPRRVLKVADLFCGGGGFSKGAMKMIMAAHRRRQWEAQT